MVIVCGQEIVLGLTKNTFRCNIKIEVERQPFQKKKNGKIQYFLHVIFTFIFYNKRPKSDKLMKKINLD